MRIKSKDLAFLLGLMEGSILGIGKRENNMDLESMSLRMEKRKLVNGSKGRDLIGLMKTKLKKNRSYLPKRPNLRLMFELFYINYKLKNYFLNLIFKISNFKKSKNKK